jgi:hypothetical protein
MMEDKEDGRGTASRLHYAQSLYYCMHQPVATLMIVVMSSVLLVYLFQGINHMTVKNHLHSSSGVQESCVGHSKVSSIENPGHTDVGIVKTLH